ncbi:S1 family peptidase [Legionella pneumophila]
MSGDNGTGTGFFFHIQLDQDKQIQLILTNKHVINGNKKLSFYFHEATTNDNQAEPTNQSFSITVEDYANLWIPHPKEEVDLGALLFVPIRNHAKEKLGKEIFNISFDDSLILNDDDLAEETDVDNKVLMIGYPIGLWDEVNNFPIVRNGITASHPSLDFNGKSEGIIDMACFPGSSGSPVLICMKGFHDKNGTYHIGASKNILLGLLFSGPYLTQSGKIEIKEIPTANLVPVASFNQMIHLGYYVKAKEILVLCEHIKNQIVISNNK